MKYEVVGKTEGSGWLIVGEAAVQEEAVEKIIQLKGLLGNGWLISARLGGDGENESHRCALSKIR